MKELLVVGTVALDDIQTPMGAHDNVLGGSAVHFSLSARKLSPVAIVGIIGKDFPGEYLTYLKDRDINTDGIATHDGDTFHWKGKYEGAMNEAQTLDTKLNALLAFNPELTDKQRDAKYVFLANIDPVLQLKVIMQLSKPKFIAADSMNYWIESKKEDLLKVLASVNMVTLNEKEVQMITGDSNTIRAGRKVLTYGPQYVVVKKGEHGCVLLSRDDAFALPAFPTENVVDPTGAGDSFAGGMMSFIMKKDDSSWKTVRRAAAHGTVMSSFNITGLGGAAFDDVEKKAIKRRAKQLRKLCSF